MTRPTTTPGYQLSPSAQALDRVVDRQVATLLAAPSEAAPPSLPWGEDAGSSPSTYRHWLREQIERSSRHPVPVSGRSGPAPLLTVIVPLRQSTSDSLGRSVRSVTDQTHGRWELFLCGGASEVTASAGVVDATDARIKSAVPLGIQEGTGGVDHTSSMAVNRAVSLAAGEFILFLADGDVLSPHALAQIAAVVDSVDDVDVVYSDEDELDAQGQRGHPSFKPDWDPELLLSYPYLGHVFGVRRDLLRRIGGLRPEFGDGEVFDLMLRATEGARRVVHLPEVLYHRTPDDREAIEGSGWAPWAPPGGRRVLESALDRRQVDAVVEEGPFAGAFEVRRQIEGTPSVSIIVPFRDQAALTVSCLASLRNDPGHPVGEVVLIDNGSTEPETVVLRRRLEAMPGIRLLDYPGPFNWAAINNQAAATCGSDLLVFMNNDIEATSAGWLRALVEQAQIPDVGAVGARLLYPDGSIQHAGVVWGMQGIAAHLFSGMPEDHTGYLWWDRLVRSYSVVTGACLMVRREVFEGLNGFDEVYPVAFNDVDFCLRLGQAGYRVVCTPHAELTHYESVSRGLSGYSADYQAFLARWSQWIRQDDPFYNRNLSRFASWCPLRAPGEDDQWLATMESLIPASVGDAEPA